jgi:hypothetical protein
MKLQGSGMAIRLTAIHSSYHYPMKVGAQGTVEQVVRFLARTLEIARPVLTDQRLEDLDLQAGDRLLFFTQPSKAVVMPAIVRPGDKTLRFQMGEVELESRGKKTLLVGKPDATNIPDIDLRYLVSPKALEFVSSSCLWLSFDEFMRTWYATKAGNTRVMVDEFELGADRIALNETHRIRFFGDNRRIGEMRVSVETAREQGMQIAAGNERLELRVGAEQAAQALNASPNVRIEQVARQLAKYYRVQDDSRLHIARLVAPQTPIGTLNVGEDSFLYAPLNLRQAHNILALRDSSQRERVHVLAGGYTETEYFIGCRAQAEVQSPDLSVDLYDSITAQGNDPRPFQGISPYFARISYRGQGWWIRLDERAHLPVFVNSLRVSSAAPIQLTSGDVLSFGPSVTHFYARLEVEVNPRGDI